MLEFKIDFLFCFGDRILKGRILEVYKNKIINFHPSLLPAFSGLNAIDKALNSSVQILGNTAHFIDEGIDTGPIIMQSVIPRNSYTCYEDVLSLQIPMLLRIWELIDSNKITVIDNLVVVKSLINKDPFFSL
jgi:phosphoribosylglycinamide formyltransferase-1